MWDMQAKAAQPHTGVGSDGLIRFKCGLNFN